MVSTRLVVGGIAAVVAVGALLLLPSPLDDAGEAIEVVEVAVGIHGPDGWLWNGTVRSAPTAFEALRTAAEAGGFTITWTGAGPTLYVDSIAGYQAAGPGGWCYFVDRGEGFQLPDRSAGVLMLETGDRTRWAWTDAGCRP